MITNENTRSCLSLSASGGLSGGIEPRLDQHVSNSAGLSMYRAQRRGRGLIHAVRGCRQMYGPRPHSIGGITLWRSGGGFKTLAAAEKYERACGMASCPTVFASPVRHAARLHRPVRMRCGG
jgi:hypothetical protein